MTREEWTEKLIIGIESLREDAISTVKLIDDVETTPPSVWEPASKHPATDDKCVVITKDGAMYFQTPNNGKLMSNVKWWCKLPKLPE